MILSITIRDRVDAKNKQTTFFRLNPNDQAHFTALAITVKMEGVL